GASGGSSGSATGGFKQAAQSSGPLTVWVDSSRVPAVQAYKKANPNVKLNVVTYDGDANGSNTLQTKVSLYDRTGSGWPDVVFSAESNEVSWAEPAGFTAPLNKGLISNSVLSQFSTGALAPCTVNGTVYCLRNDLAPVVLWYNAPLMKKWGYQVPTTWAQYQQIGEEVAKQHPGYIVGAAGDTFAPEIYMWAGKCQANDVTGPKSVTVKTDTTECKRVASMLDTLRGDGTLPAISVFTPEFVKSYTGKVLMMPGPSWYAGAIFNNKQSLNVPAGQLGVAAPLKWKDDSKGFAGNVGGGTWFISSHSKNLKAAEKFTEFVTTADDYQVDAAPGYPAYAPAATKWIAKQESSKYFATSLAPVVSGASEVWDGWGYPIFSQEAVWAKTMTPAITGGKSIVSLLPTWRDAIANQAKVDGYTVN
ncbi:MAG: ABC transporter substrate-binding protein, partial [Leifsonia sp.]